jgi:hypothetical protein
LALRRRGGWRADTRGVHHVLLLARGPRSGAAGHDARRRRTHAASLSQPHHVKRRDALAATSRGAV